MKDLKANPIVRVLPSLTDVAFLMPLVFVFFRMGGATKMLEGDTGWHIRTGEWILANGRVPDSDFYSFSHPGEPWFAWEWGWDVLFGWMHSLWGMPAVVFASVIVLSLAFALLFRLVLRKCENPVLAIGVTLLAAAASSVHWWARPHLFTFLFVVVFYHILERHRDGEKSPLWVLPVLMVLWTNLHGGFIAGILMLGCYAAGELIQAALAATAIERREAFGRSVPYMISGAACFAVTFLNPYTYHLHVHILQYLGDSDSPFFRWVSEWQSVSFHYAGARYFEVMIILATASAVWCLLRREFVYTLLVVGWMHLGLVSARHIPIFALVSAPVVAGMLEAALTGLKRADLARWVRCSVEVVDEIGGELAPLDRVRRLHLVSILVVAMVGLAIFAPNPPDRFLADYNPEHYPKEAVDALGVQMLSGDVFASDEWGDYLIYRLHPSTKVFVDGRFDFYGADFTEEYLNLMNVGKEWDQTLSTYQITSALLPVHSSLSATLRESGRWQAVYEDDVAVLLKATCGKAAKEDASSIAVTNCSGSNGDREVTDVSGETKSLTQTQSERRESL